jgi:hypothetical protein
MRAVSLGTLLLGCASGLSLTGGDNTETLILWQVLKNGGNMQTQANMMPLLMTQLFKDDKSVMNSGATGGDDDIQQMLLMSSFSNPEMEQWLPFVLFSEKKMQDKLLMMQYLQMMEGQGMSGMSEVFPIMLMNDDRYCNLKNTAGTDAICNCQSSRSDTILKIMLLTGGSFLGNSPQQNLFFLLFNNDDSCSCTFEGTTETNTCSSITSEGIDPLMMYFMMNAIPQPLQQLPQAVPRSGSVDMKQLMLSQMANLPQEYQYLMNIDKTQRSELMKLQLYQTMGVPPAMIELFSAKQAGTPLQAGDKFNMLRWLFPNQELSPELTAMMIEAEGAKKFYISSLLSTNQVPEITGILLMALAEGADTTEIKDVLIQVASGQLNPEAFSIINKPYVPELPVGIYPGQDLFFIHIHLLGLDTCAMHDLANRWPCQRKQYGGRGPLNAEQCEISPYCCWNPVQVTDSEVTALTGGTVKKAVDVPWCYYNVFFIYHDQYKLKVARPIKVDFPNFAAKQYLRVGPDSIQTFTDATRTVKATLLTRANPVTLAAFTIAESVLTIEEDKFNTAFAPPAECPGLFRYGLQLDPIIYARSVTNIATGLAGASAGTTVENSKLKALLNVRSDCGFPGIPKFQCVAIRGCCWDETAYNPMFKIPQCYKRIDLIPASVFKIVAPPAELRPVPGECNTNFFRVPQLYYEREACNYGFDMFKYGGIEGDKTPLDTPTPNDCIFKLGCCWEDDEEVVRKYDWIPRCYKRQRAEDGVETFSPLEIQMDNLVARAGEMGGN